MQPYILVIGELLIDALSHVQIENLSEATVLNIHAGGSAANFCRYLKRCGTSSKLIAAVGEDGMGEILLDKVKADGIDTSLIKKIARHSTSMIVVARTNGTPDFIPYRDADTYIEAPADDLIANAVMIHTSAFALSKNPARQHILDALKKAAELNIPISVDWNYSEKIWGNITLAREVFEEIITYQPYLKFSLDDITRFAERRLNIDQAKDFLTAYPSKCICLTCGSQGVYYRSQDGDWQFLAAQPINVVNATGAGDAFWAGFIHSVLQNESMTNTVANGIASATLKLQGKL